ncbi:histidine phosphatase family protein [Aquisalimonas asiatica]|uniref:Histidine phosphatase superfamily (Branch 1) n=1 Tax=Aquisalimonas asiatica TaxID=406100 RepID=A0A1H8UZ60_9GAMM|nr:histidine phosphatase family protein [Aquisalimonas asiatica]SEP08502.1 Histidine phosphatase superfamily (branch 1) [Aquisalimonas asiatica]
MSDCDAQRTLSDEGREQAATVGRLLRKMGFRAGAVYSSSYCRNLETAERGFPWKSVEHNDAALFNQPALSQGPLVDDVVAGLRQLLSDPPEEANRVLVGHNLNLQSAAGVHLREGEMAVFRPDDSSDGFELVARFSKDDLREQVAVLGDETGAWQGEDAVAMAVAVHAHMRDVEALFRNAWAAEAGGHRRGRVRNAAQLELARRVDDDPAIDMSVTDYYALLAKAAYDGPLRERISNAAEAAAPVVHEIGEKALDVAESKAWLHGDEALHPDGRVPHITVGHAIAELGGRADSRMAGDVIEVTGMLDFSFIARAQEREAGHGFYLLSDHDPAAGVFSELLCVRDDIERIALDLPLPDEDMSEDEREAAILSRIRSSANGIADYTQRNLMGTSRFSGRLLNVVLLTDCRTFLK